MLTISLIGVPGAGKSTTLRRLYRQEGDRTEMFVADSARLICATSPLRGVRIATFPGTATHDAHIRELALSSDLIVCTVDAQLATFPDQARFFERHPALRLRPRIWQINKADIASTARARVELRSLGAEEHQPICKTTAVTGDGVQDLLIDAVRQYDFRGPGAEVRDAVKRAFPDRAAPILYALDRRWLAWNRGDLGACPHCGQRLLLWISEIGGGAIPTGVAQEPPGPPSLLPPLPPPEYSRDLLLAELRRALSENAFRRVERGCGRDEEPRRMQSCPHCKKGAPMLARLDGSRWRLALTKT